MRKLEVVVSLGSVFGQGEGGLNSGLACQTPGLAVKEEIRKQHLLVLSLHLLVLAPVVRYLHWRLLCIRTSKQDHRDVLVCSLIEENLNSQM
jgi:hypothetical protein